MTWFGQARPESPKPFALPAGDRVRLDIKQRTAPAGPPPPESDPEGPIEGREDRPLTLSLEGRKLEAESGILDCHGLVTAHEESQEAKN
jgi:hypothetical protein